MKIQRGLIKAIKKAKKIAVFVHSGPDGDAIGSSSALFYALSKIGKEIDLYSPDDFSSKYIVNCDGLKFYGEMQDRQYDLMIAVDCSDSKRMGKFSQIFEKFNNRMVIDHHVGNVFSCEHSIVDFEKAACAEIVYEIVKALRVKIDINIANSIFLGIITDTGCFKFQNVTYNTFDVAKEMIHCGAESKKMIYKFFQSKTKTQIKLNKELYSNLVFHSSGITSSFIDNETFKRMKATKNDFVGFSSVITEIENVKIGFFMLEIEKGFFEISVRSFDEVNALNVVKEFNGGGHIHACGMSAIGDFEEIRAKVVELCKKEIKRCRKLKAE